jgi:hypothetical protein
MQDLEQAIRERAFDLWIASGCENGNAETHWLAAQREVLGAKLNAVGHVTASKPQTSKKSEKPKNALTKKKPRAA